MLQCLNQFIFFGEPEEHKYRKHFFFQIICCQNVYLLAYSHVCKGEFDWKLKEAFSLEQYQWNAVFFSRGPWDRMIVDFCCRRVTIGTPVRPPLSSYVPFSTGTLLALNSIWRVKWCRWVILHVAVTEWLILFAENGHQKVLSRSSSWCCVHFSLINSSPTDKQNVCTNLIFIWQISSFRPFPLILFKPAFLHGPVVGLQVFQWGQKHSFALFHKIKTRWPILLLWKDDSLVYHHSLEVCISAAWVLRHASCSTQRHSL